MSQPVTIEAGQKSDREWCSRLMASTEPWITLRCRLKACRAVLRRPGAELFVAWEGRRRLGFLLASPHGLAGAPYINSVAVKESERERGIGSQLLAFAERHFAGRRHLFLCVSSFNRRALQLYRKLGYERIAGLKDHIIDGYSEFLLHKRLP